MKQPFFSNYDYVDMPSGPGGGYSTLHNYKSISDFLKKKRKKKKSKSTLRILQRIKQALDFPLDNYIEPIIGDQESYYSPMQLGPAGKDTSIMPQSTNFPDYEGYATPIMGGIYDSHFPLPDADNKSFDQLNFGNDINNPQTAICPSCGATNQDDLVCDHCFMFMPKEPSLFGLPDGITEPESLDNPAKGNPWYGILDNVRTPIPPDLLEM